MLIRAVNGHSMSVVCDDLLLDRITLDTVPPVCIHGTYRKHFRAICSAGLQAGGGKGIRRHIHFQPFEPGDRRCLSSMRANSEVAIYSNLKQAVQDGIPFYFTRNDVIVSPGPLPSTYFIKARDLVTHMQMSF